MTLFSKNDTTCVYTYLEPGNTKCRIPLLFPSDDKSYNIYLDVSMSCGSLIPLHYDFCLFSYTVTNIESRYLLPNFGRTDVSNIDPIYTPKQFMCMTNIKETIQIASGVRGRKNATIVVTKENMVTLEQGVAYVGVLTVRIEEILI